MRFVTKKQQKREELRLLGLNLLIAQAASMMGRCGEHLTLDVVREDSEYLPPREVGTRLHKSATDLLAARDDAMRDA